MKQQIRNIILILLIVDLTFTVSVKAQSDSIPENYFTTLQQNVNQLSELYIFTDPDFYAGRIESESVSNFSEKYNSLNLLVFPEVLDKSQDYYQFFISLPENDKKRLVQIFSFYEKDIEKELQKAGLPPELKYLAPAISALNFYSIGSERRAGIWQLTHFQTLLNGGEISRLVDERLNVSLSTKLAARQFKENLEIYTNAELAVLAFLSGNAAVKNVTFFLGEDANAIEILNQLPEAISDQIAAFQAMSVFLNTNRFIQESTAGEQQNSNDTVLVYRQTHFNQIEKVMGIPVKQIQDLNPQYKFSIVPENSKGKKLVLPRGKRNDFVVWNDSINNVFDSVDFQMITQKIEYPPAPNRQYLGETVKDLVIEGKTKIKYRLKTGNVLGIIAEIYDVRVADLKYWNNIVNERRIQAGQMIDIFVPDDQVQYYTNLENPSAGDIGNENVGERIQNTTSKVYEQFDMTQKVEHIVKSGESPFIIAQKYVGVTPELILEWNNIDNPRRIQIGQKLIIYPQK